MNTQFPKNFIECFTDIGRRDTFAPTTSGLRSLLSPLRSIRIATVFICGPADELRLPHHGGLLTIQPFGHLTLLPIVYDSAIAAVRQLLQHGAPDCLRFFACVGSYHHAPIAFNSA